MVHNKEECELWSLQTYHAIDTCLTLSKIFVATLGALTDNLHLDIGLCALQVFFFLKDLMQPSSLVGMLLLNIR